MTNFEKIIGLRVITLDAHTLGEVKGARVDTETWEVKYLNVALSATARKFRSSAISIPVSLVKAVSEVVLIGKLMEELETDREILEDKD